MFKQGERRPFARMQEEMERMRRQHNVAFAQMATVAKRLADEVTAKADADDVELALARKANAATVGGISTALNSKADRADLK